MENIKNTFLGCSLVRMDENAANSRHTVFDDIKILVSGTIRKE